MLVLEGFGSLGDGGGGDGGVEKQSRRLEQERRLIVRLLILFQLSWSMCRVVCRVVVVVMVVEEHWLARWHFSFSIWLSLLFRFHVRVVHVSGLAATHSEKGQNWEVIRCTARGAPC